MSICIHIHIIMFYLHIRSERPDLKTLRCSRAQECSENFGREYSRLLNRASGLRAGLRARLWAGGFPISRFPPLGSGLRRTLAKPRARGLTGESLVWGAAARLLSC